jgi:hypothetical protein
MDAQRMDQSDDHRRHKSPADAAQPTGDHHHKGFHNHGHVHLQMCRLTRQLKRTTESGQGAAKHDRTEHQWPGIDAQAAQNLSVLRRCAQTLTKQGAGEQKMQSQPDQRAKRHEHQLVAWKILLAHLHRPLEPRETGRKHLLIAEEPAHGVMQGQSQAKSGHQLVQLRGANHAPQQQDIGQRTDQRSHQSAQDHGQQVKPGAVGPIWIPMHQPMGGKQRTQHEKAAMGKVDDPGDPKNQGQARRHQEQGAGIRQPTEQLNRSDGAAHLSL